MWFLKLLKKRIKMYFKYIVFKISRKKYLIRRDIKLAFSHPYHYLFALNMDKREDYWIDEWRKAARQSKIIVDAGSYNGMFGILAAKENPDADVFLIEPEPTNIKHIKKNIELNNVKVTLIEGVLSNKRGISSFSGLKGHTAGYIEKNLHEKTSSTSTKSITLNDLMPDLVKLDIEGAEVMALKAGEKFLQKNPTIFLELHREFIKRYNNTEEELWSLLSKFHKKKMGTEVQADFYIITKP